MKIKLTLSEKQAQHIENALDLYARINLGQLDTLMWAIGPHRPEEYKLPWLGSGIKEIEDLKKYLFPELPLNGYHGIHSKKVPEIAREMMDIKEVIRHFLAWKKNPEGGNTVNFYEPSHYSDKELPEIK